MGFNNNAELMNSAVVAVAETAPSNWTKILLYFEFLQDAEIGLRNKWVARCFTGNNFEIRLDAYNVGRSTKSFNALKAVYDDAVQNNSIWSGILLTIFNDGQFKCRLYYGSTPLLSGDDSALEEIMSKGVIDLPKS